MVHTLKEQRKEGYHKYKEDANDAALDPLENGHEVVTTCLPANELSDISILANDQLGVQSSQEHH
jgi:hypothetical protein